MSFFFFRQRVLMGVLGSQVVQVRRDEAAVVRHVEWY